MVEKDELGWDVADRWHLHELNDAACRDFDTALRALSGGGLAVSIVFVHQIANHPGHKWLLGLSRMLFASALAFNLLSFLTSGRASRRMLNEMDDPETTELQPGKITERLNWGSCIAFLVGLVCLVDHNRQQPGPHGGSLGSQLIGNDAVSALGLAGTLHKRSS